jgi:succinate-semialdehyde dehydrogenase/glutarate-semialdehyde dehydrogenase
MGLASYFFTKNVDRTWRLLENLEAGMIGMNTGESSLPPKLKLGILLICSV